MTDDLLTMTPLERKLYWQRKTQAVDESAERGCLACGEPFRSQWPGNRICGTCKETDV